MDFQLLLAEQSVYAYLNVEAIPSNLTTFQRSVDPTYVYAKALAREPLSDVPPENYSITNLPDTISYVPLNSIFSNIMTIRGEDPDYRFVGISQPAHLFEENRQPALISDKNLPLFRVQEPVPRQNIFRTEQQQQQMLNNLLPNQSQQQQQQRGGQQVDVNSLMYDDPKFDNVASASNLSGFSSLTRSIVGIIRAPPTTVANSNWYTKLYDQYNYANAQQIEDILNGTNPHKNNKTMTYKIINALSAEDKTNLDTTEQYQEMKNIIDTFLATLQ